jgi:hypothetical protein
VADDQDDEIGRRIIGAVTVGALTAFTSVTACNTGNGTCPDKAAVVPGGSCSDNDLQCAFDLKTPAVACDGTSTVIETSCTCTHGTWDCPPVLDCGEAGAPPEDEAGGGDTDGGDTEGGDTDGGDTDGGDTDSGDSGSTDAGTG